MRTLNRPVLLVTLLTSFYCIPATSSSSSRLGGGDSRTQQRGEYCEGEVFTARCQAADEVLLMEQALYGRMRAGKCIEDAFATLDMGCSADVIGLLNDRCSGRHHCTMDVRDIIGYNNCTSKQLRSYLEVRYSCMKVAVVTRGACHGPTPVPAMTSSSGQASGNSGYLSSFVTQQTECGGRENPWSIKANAGQRISVELVDFAANQSTSSSCVTADSTTHVTSCLVYATIRDTSGSVMQTVCGCRGRKVAPVFVSTSHSIEISIYARPDKLTGHFLLKYSVDGCANPRLPDGAWMKRDDKEAVIGCKPKSSSSSSDVITTPYFLLKCVNGQWDPPSVTCSSRVAVDGGSVSAGGGAAAAAAAAASAHGPHPGPAAAGGFISSPRSAAAAGVSGGDVIDADDTSKPSMNSELLVIVVAVAVLCITLTMFVLGIVCLRRKHKGPKLQIHSSPGIDHMTYGQTTLAYTALSQQQQAAMTSSRPAAASPSSSSSSSKPKSRRVDPSTTRAAEFQFVNTASPAPSSSAAAAVAASASNKRQQQQQQHRVLLHQQLEMHTVGGNNSSGGGGSRLATTTSTLPLNGASHHNSRHAAANHVSASSSTYANTNGHGASNNQCIYSNVSSAYNTVNPNARRLSPILSSPIATATPPQPPKVTARVVVDKEDIYETAFVTIPSSSAVVTESCDDITSDHRQATPQFVVDLKKCMAQQHNQLTK